MSDSTWLNRLLVRLSAIMMLYHIACVYECICLYECLYLVVSIVGSHSVVRMTGNATEILVPQQPTVFIVATNLVSGARNGDQGTIERHEKFAHGDGMKTEKCINRLHLCIITIRLVKSCSAPE